MDEDQWGHMFVLMAVGIVVLSAHFKQIFLVLGSFPPDAQGGYNGMYSPWTKESALSTYSTNFECLVSSPVV